MKPDASAPIGAAIDIGSNSIKMTVARVGPDGALDELDRIYEVVRLGHDLERTGRLEEERVEAAIETLRRFAERAREGGASRIAAVATEAARVASNGAAFLDRVRHETGIDVRVIDGQEEAALTFRGITATHELPGEAVIADIGGGSTELIISSDGTMRAFQSIGLGSGRLTDRLVASDPPAPEELAASKAEAENAIQTALQAMEISPGRAGRLIIVGGTGEFLARLVPADRTIDGASVAVALERLASLSAAELGDELAIPEARARVLPAGVAIVAALAEWMRPEQIEISHSGIRTGLLVATFDSRNGGSGGDHSGSPQPFQPAAQPGLPSADSGPTSETDFRETMRSAIAERWDAVWEAIPVALAGTEIEGVHDVRVASRRLRAAMDIAAPAFPHGWYRTLHRTAKEITRELGSVRDRDVLLAALRRERDAAPLTERPGIDRLIDRVERERSAARIEMEHYLRTLLAGPTRADIEARFKGIGVNAPPSEEEGSTG